MKRKLLLICFLTGNLVFSTDVAQKPEKYTGTKVLFGTVAAVGAISFLLWLDPTMQVIKQNGIAGALISTHLQRLGIDAATVVAGIIGIIGATKLEELEQKNYRLEHYNYEKLKECVRKDAEVVVQEQ